MIIDDDPDIQLSLSQSSAAEGDGAGGSHDHGHGEERGEWDHQRLGSDYRYRWCYRRLTDFTATTPVALTIDAGATVGTATTTVTIVDDAADDDGETIQFAAANVTIGDKVYTFGSVKLAITDNDDS